jgi:hypothetical protein
MDDLTPEDLVYLMQLVNADFCNKQRKTQEPTPIEAEVFRKLQVLSQKTETTQFTGNYVGRLMEIVYKTLRKLPPVPEVGGMVVNAGGVKWRVGPEVIESFRRIEGEKQKSIASGKPVATGEWQTRDTKVRAIMKAVIKKIVFSDLFPE